MDTDWRWMIVVAVAATACGFNSGGDSADSTGTSTTSATDPSTDPATTDPVTTDDETTETDPSQGSSTGGDPGPYGPCDGNVCADDQMCAVAENDNNMVVARSCRPPCGDVGECPPPPNGSPQLFCPAPGYPWCVLECSMGGCPEGMECYDTDFGQHCHWPL